MHRVCHPFETKGRTKKSVSGDVETSSTGAGLTERPASQGNLVAPFQQHGGQTAWLMVADLKMYDSQAFPSLLP